MTGTIRLPKDLIKVIDIMCKKYKVTRSEIIRESVSLFMECTNQTKYGGTSVDDDSKEKEVERNGKRTKRVHTKNQ